MNWLKQILIRWLLADHEGRLKDIERHFVTKRDPETGEVTETLADVPLKAREHKPLNQMRGMSMAQRKAWLEKTDGGRKV